MHATSRPCATHIRLPALILALFIGSMTDAAAQLTVTAVAAGENHTAYIKSDGSLWLAGNTPLGPQYVPAQVANGVAAVSAGGSTTLFVKTDGTLWAMGSNEFGQLGDGTTLARQTPVPVAAGVASVSAGGRHSLFIKTDGTLWAMGNNFRGQLGDGTTANRPFPVLVASGVTAVSAGDSHTMFIKTGGGLWAMGDNGNGQLGDATDPHFSGAPNFRVTPVQVAFGVTSVSAGMTNTFFAKSGELYAMGDFTFIGTENRTAPYNVGSGLTGTYATRYARTMFTSTDGMLRGTGSNGAGELGAGDALINTVLLTPPLAYGVARIALGSRHTMILMKDGTLWGTGDNAYGQLADGTRADRAAPVQVATGVAGFTAGNNRTGFVKIDGSLWMMGDNASGALGDGTTIGRYVPTQIATGVASATTGYAHTLFLQTNGNLSGMGWNGPGQLGDGTHSDHSAAIPIAVGVAAASASDYAHTLFAKTDGTLWAMGSNLRGQLGDGTTDDHNTPQHVPGTGVPGVPASNVTAVATGQLHSAFLRTDGSLWVMGDNTHGQLGDGSNNAQSVPIQVAIGVARIAAGYDHTLFLRTDGTLWGMGSNEVGQLGDGLGRDHNGPVQIATDVVAIAAGLQHSLFVKSDGTAWATGDNTWGQLGDGTYAQRPSPVPVATGVARVAGGWRHSLFVKTDGTLWAAGRKLEGEFGDGTIGRRTTFAQSTIIPSIAAGYFHTLFVKTDGSLWTVGANGAGQLGDGTTDDRSAPVQVATDVAGVAAGYQHTAFRKRDGTAWTVGNNQYGQLGDGTNVARSTPQQVFSGTVAVGAGSDHTFFVRNDTNETLWAAGWNFYGQLGNGNTTNQKLPVQVSTSSSLVAATGGYGHSAMLRGSVLWTIGHNHVGQLGNGTVVDLLTPAPLLGSVTGVAAGANHTLWVKSSPAGSLWATGQNFYGQLGNGSNANLSTPVQIDTGVARVTASDGHSLYVKTDGTLWATGHNARGQLGDGGNADRNAPVQVATAVHAVAAGSDHTAFVKTDGTLWTVGGNDAGQLGDGTTGSRNTAQQVANLIVPPPIVIAVQPADATTTVGGSASFAVVAAGTGPISYQWYQDGVAIGGETSATYAISYAQPAHAGVYLVVARNDGFSVYSDAAVLDVGPAAQTIAFAPLPDRTSGEAPFALAATASSGLPVAFTLLAGPATLAGNIVTLTGTGTVSIRATQGGSAAWVAAPAVERSFAVTASAGIPAAPVATSATGVSAADFIANWSGASGATGYRLDVSTSVSFNSFVSGYQDLDVGYAFSRSVTGLGAATPYYYRLRAVNAAGTSAPSGTITVFTAAPATTPPAAPVAIAATAAASGSFTARWTPSGGATGYRLDVSTSSSFNGYVGGFENLDVGAATSRSVTGLNGGTIHYYRVRATNGAGASANSGTMSVTLPPAAPVAQAATGVSSVGFTANWTPAGGATGYRLDVSRSSSFVGFVAGYRDLDVGNVASRKVSGLRAGTNYYYRLRAYDTGGTGSDSGTITVTTGAPAYTFTTYAGVPGATGTQDGTGAAARFDSPNSVIVDGDGNLLVTDSGNGRIRRIGTDAAVTTIASGFLGPVGIAMDGNGNLYVADNSNQVINKIATGGVVTILAGAAGIRGNTDGTGADARFHYPRGVAVDGSGNIFVTDGYYGSTIRRITSEGVVTTYAGSAVAGSDGSVDGPVGSARFRSPNGIAFDVPGNLFVADMGNDTVRRITTLDVVSTIAGTARSQGSADGTGSAALFTLPRGVAVDASGNLFVADTLNSTIRRITPAGAVTTIGGSAGMHGYVDGEGNAARFTAPVGVAVDADGNLFITDGGNSTIRKGTPPASIVVPTLDVDASITATKYDALTDGLLVIRYLFGLTGTSLTTGALGTSATRTDPAAIMAYLDDVRPALDIDGDGEADALTDGLLIIRYLFGLRGSALIAGAVDPLATRKTAEEIEAYLLTLMP